MSLQDFLKNNGGGFTPTATTGGEQPSAGGLQAFLQNKGGGGQVITPQTEATQQPKVEEEKKTSKIGDSFRFIGKQLMKPIGVAAKELRATGEVIGSLAAIASPKISAGEGFKFAAQSFLRNQKGAYNVLAGNEETSISREFEKAGIPQDKLDKVMSIGGDFVLDPLNFIPVAKVAKVLGKGVKSVKKVKAVAKVLAPIEKATLSAKNAPAAKKLKSLFSNATGDPEFDKAVSKFRNLFAYREANLIDDAVKIQKDIKNISKSLGKNAGEIEMQIVNGLENKAGLFSKVARGADEERDAIMAGLNQLKKKPSAIMDIDTIDNWLNLAEKNKLPVDDLVEAQAFLRNKGINVFAKKPNLDKRVMNIVENLNKTYSALLSESKKVGLKVGEIAEYAPHIRTKESFGSKLGQHLGMGAKEFGKGSVEKGRKLEGTIEELTKKGIDIFEKNPAIQLAKKGQTFAKAITSAEFATEMKKFAVKDGGVDVTNTFLKGSKFAPEHAKVIDNFYQGIKPEEINVILKGFDKVQNLWKAQALISPSYHTRNIAGNLWNNFLANVNPAMYGKAGLMQKGMIKDAKLMDEMQKLGVINEGWYAADIGEEVINRVKGAGNWKSSINPLSQENALFKMNKRAGSVIENNARMAHYMSKKAAGMTADEAAQSVKKYLFDYSDLTSFEKNVMKRAAPFYTWSRKNLPVQLEALFTQPEKMVLPHKIIQQLESGSEMPNEKYMGHYIKSNIPVRTKVNKDGNTEYFLMGNWLPYASAIDLLSNPLESIVGMTTPFVKTPYEIASNQSTFFKDTLGDPSKIERRYKQQGEFLGMSLRKKNIQLLRNIRILNDMNKMLDKKDPTAVKNSWEVKLMNVFFGKAATYDVGKSKYFYDMDTEDRMSELKRAIKDAARRGFGEKANKLRNELQEFKQHRYGDE